MATKKSQNNTTLTLVDNKGEPIHQTQNLSPEVAAIVRRIMYRVLVKKMHKKVSFKTGTSE